MELRTADEAVTLAEPDTAPSVALTFEVPDATPVTCPWLPIELLTVTAAGLVLLHVTELVRFKVVPSENVPIAVNCELVPLGR